MSHEAAAIVGALLAAFASAIAILTLRIADLRERIARLEEWRRYDEKRNGRGAGSE